MSNQISKTFRFYLDQKCTTWYRTHFEIDSESEEEAIKKAVEMFESDTIPDDWFHLYETTENMSKIDNGGQPTQELLIRRQETTDEIIKTN